MTVASLLWVLIPSFVVGVTSFIVGMYVFKAKSETKAEVREISIDKELATIQKDIGRLESKKVDKERLELLHEDIKRLDSNKADREIVAMMQEQIKEIRADVTEIGANVVEILRKLS